MCVLFVKQKTAYELRISDWSSDVCSSDLGVFGGIVDVVDGVLPQLGATEVDHVLAVFLDVGGGAVDEIDVRTVVAVLPHLAADDVGKEFRVHMRAGGAADLVGIGLGRIPRSEEHTSELQSLMRISYA